MQAVKPFIGMISREAYLFDEIKSNLTAYLGPVDGESPIWPWDHTDYYEKEIGKGLKRKFLFFFNLISPEGLPDVKIKTIELERLYSRDGNRSINLDPGYIHPAKLVLATTKDYSHRIYLRDGVYAEVTLYYHKHSFQPFPYTYPDFRGRGYIELFNRIRDDYVRGLRAR